MIQTAINGQIAEQLRDLWPSQGMSGVISDTVYHVLHRAIVGSILPQGHRLGEDQLARIFGVSRTPVREALLRLEAENLAERIPRRGLVVSRVITTVADIEGVYLVRQTLDDLAVFLAAQRATPRDIARLESIHRQFVEAIETDDFRRMSDCQLQFHETIARISGNPLLPEFVRQTILQIRRFGTTTFGSGERARLAAETHAQLIAAIAAHDVDRARQLAKEDTAVSQRIRVSALEEGRSLARRPDAVDR